MERTGKGFTVKGVAFPELSTNLMCVYVYISVLVLQRMITILHFNDQVEAIYHCMGD
jgi:hypothetical protein